jgi:hypothetical protein
MTEAISRPLAGWMGPKFPTIEMAQNKAYTALLDISTQDFFNFIQGDPSLLAGIPTLACGGVGWRVSRQGERRDCRGDWGERCAHGAERRRLRESSPGARIRRGGRSDEFVKRIAF